VKKKESGESVMAQMKEIKEGASESDEE